MGESRIEAAIWCEKGRLANRGSLTIALTLLEGRASHLDSNSIRTTSSNSSARAWFSGMENQCNEQRTLKGSPFDDPNPLFLAIFRARHLMVEGFGSRYKAPKKVSVPNPVLHIHIASGTGSGPDEIGWLLHCLS